jgi:hypothetical protein
VMGTRWLRLAGDWGDTNRPSPTGSIGMDFAPMGMSATRREAASQRSDWKRLSMPVCRRRKSRSRQTGARPPCAIGCEHGLKTQRSAGARPREATVAARAQGLLEALLLCSHHGEVSHVRDSRGYFRCRACRAEAVVRRRRRVKQILVEEAGGSCRLCGYDRSPAALEFHHVDPHEKQFGVAAGGMARSLDRLRAEVRKCVLLCSNCHAEVEAGTRSISGVVQ